MDEWSFFNPTSIEFSENSIDTIGSIIDYQRVVLVTTPGFTQRGTVARVEKSLGDRLVGMFDNVKPNPDVEDIDATAELLRSYNPDCLMGLGGGSSLDTAKALARILPMPEGMTLTDHFRKKTPLSGGRALPIITIPTTAGTGAEVTPFATIWDFRQKKKYSLTGNDLFPIKAFLDPALTYDLPELLTISSGLDAISHALESVWNKNANPVSIGLATQSLPISLETLPQLKKNPEELASRAAMMEASLLAGMAISQTRTALAHSISYPLTLAFNLPHGIACSFTLPAILRFNAYADDGRLKKLASCLGFGNIDKLANTLSTLLLDLDVPNLFTDYVPDYKQALALTHEMLTPGRANNNLRPANTADVYSIVEDACKHFRKL